MSVLARCVIVSSTLFVVIALYGVEAICKDVIVNCDDYNDDLCTSFPFWATQNCQRWCKMCPVEECPQGWTTYEADKTCIKVVGTNNPFNHSSWENARLSCQEEAEGGDLVIIGDEEKNAFVFGLLGPYFSYWIGISNVAKTGFSFQYVNGSQLETYHPWLPGNPDNDDGHEKCVVMYVDTDFNSQWNDYACSARLPYVCSKSFN